jgi:hypothetical protein
VYQSARIAAAKPLMSSGYAPRFTKVADAGGEGICSLFTLVDMAIVEMYIKLCTGFSPLASFTVARLHNREKGAED